MSNLLPPAKLIKQKYANININSAIACKSKDNPLIDLPAELVGEIMSYRDPYEPLQLFVDKLQIYETTHKNFSIKDPNVNKQYKDEYSGLYFSLYMENILNLDKYQNILTFMRCQALVKKHANQFITSEFKEMIKLCNDLTENKRFYYKKEKDIPFIQKMLYKIYSVLKYFECYDEIIRLMNINKDETIDIIKTGGDNIIYNFIMKDDTNLADYHKRLVADLTKIVNKPNGGYPTFLKNNIELKKETGSYPKKIINYFKFILQDLTTYDSLLPDKPNEEDLSETEKQIIKRLFPGTEINAVTNALRGEYIEAINRFLEYIETNKPKNKKTVAQNGISGLINNVNDNKTTILNNLLTIYQESILLYIGGAVKSNDSSDDEVIGILNISDQTKPPVKGKFGIYVDAVIEYHKKLSSSGGKRKSTKSTSKKSGKKSAGSKKPKSPAKAKSGTKRKSPAKSTKKSNK